MSPYSLMIRHTPAILERMLDEIPQTRYVEKVAPDRFTLLEVVAHMADWEETVMDRLVTSVERSGSEVPNFDEEARAKEKKYDEKDIRHELAVFASRRRDTVEYIETLAPSALANTFVHPAFGQRTVEEQIGLIAGHDLYHLEQVSQYLDELNELIP